MLRKKISIERELKSNSQNIIWSFIGTPEGLSKWIADEVREDDSGQLTFTWGDVLRHHETKTAVVVDVQKYKSYKFRWLDEHEDMFVEMRIDKSDLTNDYILAITDFASDDDTESLADLWKDNLERLHMVSGL